MSVQEQLRELFVIDQQVRGLRSRVDAASRRLNAQRNKLEQLQRQAAELNEQHLKAKASAGNLEADSKGVDERIEKVRQTMSGVRSNKEYSALLVEVNTLKGEKDVVETKALEQLSKVEEIEALTEEVNAKVEAQAKLVAGAEKEVKDGEAEIADQLGDLESERDAAAEPIDPETLSLYQKLNEDTDGEALGEIEEQDRRRMEYTCGACFMSLPIQVVNATLTATDKPVICSSCGRILFAKAELKEALTPNK
ncbi:MAG: C4-type zinc ribbon domain-containing protein [Planctomycetota bacterium]